MPKSIEVEKRFILSPQIRNYIQTTFVKESEAIFQDTYYDTTALDLMGRDAWLRQRSNDWELKIRSDSPMWHQYMQTQTLTQSERPSSTVNSYLEITDTQEIISLLNAVLHKTASTQELNDDAGESKDASPHSNAATDANEAIKSLDLNAVCTITTHRQRFIAAQTENDLHLDVDDCTFAHASNHTSSLLLTDTQSDYSIVEIERIVDDPSLVAKAEADIASFASLHGIASDPKAKSAPSKVFVALRKCRPDVFQMLASMPIYAERLQSKAAGK
eukprot:TRINITY_DN6503_c0_g3_i2.p1 TRINITY_DN6503_c0_g3~~TRINITY_DN6503_c0_g3_i2.p1  ORF type:complete len:274 (+),score=73.94 TRINITY_DN6503_c0_g3_i2:92-913(+)